MSEWKIGDKIGVARINKEKKKKNWKEFYKEAEWNKRLE